MVFAKSLRRIRLFMWVSEGGSLMTSVGACATNAAITGDATFGVILTSAANGLSSGFLSFDRRGPMARVTSLCAILVGRYQYSLKTMAYFSRQSRSGFTYFQVNTTAAAWKLCVLEFCYFSISLIFVSRFCGNSYLSDGSRSVKFPAEPSNCKDITGRVPVQSAKLRLPLGYDVFAYFISSWSCVDS